MNQPSSQTLRELGIVWSVLMAETLLVASIEVGIEVKAKTMAHISECIKINP
jgi:hypothetical protein